MMKILSNSELTIGVKSFGAELASIRANGTEYLWQADPAYWKRHSPVLFPFVGSVWEGAYRHQGVSYQMGQHGFARDMEFEQLHESAAEVRFRLVSNEETRKKYPFDFELEIGYRLRGRKIDVMWKVRNTGHETLLFQIGAHPAFYYPGFKAEEAMKGYFGFDRKEDLEYILVAEKGCADPDTRYPLTLNEEGLLPIDVHTFDRDALILENSQLKEVVLYTPDRCPWLSMQFEAPVVGLWSPPSKNAPFVCIEPWYGRCDRAHFSGELKDKEWMQHLEAGEVFESVYTIEIK